jgi:glucose/mannose-6-phosphate isomerase
MSDFSLDDPAGYSKLDPDDMYRRVEQLPEQMEDAWNLAGQVELPDSFRSVRSIVVAGMGGSAIGGSLVEAYGSEEMPVPFAVWRGYGLPAYADENTLVIAVSYSGNTEETLSGLIEARERGCKLMAISTNGQVMEFANTWQVPLMTFRYEAQPRATLGYLFTPLVRIVERLGFLPAQNRAFDEALRVAREANEQWGSGVPTGSNLAKQMAAECANRTVVVYGAQYLSAVARRWKTQLNENSKNWAFWEEFPELNHNAIVGYEYPASFPDSVHLVMLSGSHLHERIRIRMDVTRRLLERFNISYRVAEARGDGRLAQMFSLIALGDYVSYYLALLNGADPTTIEPINFLKKSLAEHEAASAPPLKEDGVRPGLTIPKHPSG